MAAYHEPDSKSVQGLLRMLCSNITGLNDDELAPYYKVALTTVGSSISVPVESDEFAVAEKIKKKLVRHRREKDAALFAELHRKLQNQSPTLQNSWAVLYLLHRLQDDKSGKHKTGGGPSFYKGFRDLPTSTPFVGRMQHTPADQTTLSRTLQHSGGSVLSAAASSGIGSSTLSSIRSSQGPTPVPQSLPPSYWQTPGVTPGMPPPHHTSGNRLVAALDRRGDGTTRSEPSMDVGNSYVRQQQQQPQRHRAQQQGGGENLMFEMPQWTLLREIIYSLQGIEGKYIKMDPNKEGYKVDPKMGIPRAVRQLVCRLAEGGWLYSKVRKYADSRSTDRAFGLVGQSFCAALHQELTEYYRLMAVLEAQQQKQEDEDLCDGGVSLPAGGLTLRHLLVWTADPMVRLKAMAALVDVCQGKKGGALASAIHSYIQHGDPTIRHLVRHTLTLVAQPIFSLITRWIYDGELEDTYHEFFVASDPTVKDERLWHDKYSLRRAMVPSFLPMEQANKIMLTGKSINFLRQLCHDRTTIRHRDSVKGAETSRVESIFQQDLDGEFQTMIATVYKETSRHLLDILHSKYKFLDHLKAMRRYLLLGQGDFIRHLMDLLEEDLAKPANQLFLHNLTGILETAIRATNAQYDDPDILKRLDVRLLEVSPGDAGWDVFSLDYRVDGPIKTVFTPECMVMYLRIFNFLWRAKRMEYTLAGIWKGQMAHAKTLRQITELSEVLHKSQAIGSEMVHFVQQVQYYINFEVLECSWDELLTKVHQAEDLDHIIAAHQVFLDSVMARSLLDTMSSAILTQLRTIFDLIIQFQSITDSLYTAASDELSARHCYMDKRKRNEKQGKWGVTDEEEEKEQNRRMEFGSGVITPTRSKLRVLAGSYQNMVQQFLVMLTGHQDASLRFLSFRLDFNEHYKAKDSRLRTPQTQNKAKRRT